MGETDFQNLNQVQQAAMLELFDRMSDQAIDSGEELWLSGAVTHLNWRTPGRLLDGEVRGRPRLLVSIHFSATGEILNTICTCRLRGDCQHVVAVLLAAGEGEKDEDGDEDDDEDDDEDEDEDGDEDEDEDEDENRSQPAPAPGAPMAVAAQAPSPTAPAELFTVPPSPLAAYVIERIGGPLNRREGELVAKIEGLWREKRNVIAEPDLFVLGGHGSYFFGWQVAPVELWPADRPPRTSIEAFQYVAHALRERKKLPSMKLYQTVDWPAVDELVRRWEREKLADQWRRQLTLISLSSREAPPSPELRLRLTATGGVIEWREPGTPGFVPIKQTALRKLGMAAYEDFGDGDGSLNDLAQRFLLAVRAGYDGIVQFHHKSSEFNAALNRLLREPGFERSVVSPAGEPLVRVPEPLRWVMHEPPVAGPPDAPTPDDADYAMCLCTADGRDPGPSLATLDGWPTLFVVPDRVYEIHDPLLVASGSETRLLLPAAAIESSGGVAGLLSMNVRLPERLAARVQPVVMQVTVRCRLRPATRDTAECFEISARAHGQGRIPDDSWDGQSWHVAPQLPDPAPAKPDAPILTPDRSQELASGPWLEEARLTQLKSDRSGTLWAGRVLTGAALRSFPDDFLAWLSRRPDGLIVELDPELASLRDGTVAGRVRLDVQEAEVDWFDLRVALDVSDVELTAAEIDLLLKAGGRWVRLPDKGWRRLEFKLSDEDQSQLADLGLGVGDLTKSEPQRLHVFQLAGAAGTNLLPPERAVEVKRRAEELRTTVTPDVPAAITASLRPYQRDGYHFLAYLSANRFGGILADDMGLGKTVQTLAWLAWLKESGQLDGPVLVICPKSVQDNWRAEIARFCPGFAARVWSRESAGALDAPPPAAPAKKTPRKKPPAGPVVDDLLIINYTQLRLHEEALRARPWAAVVLDEAQYIKNPSSQTAKAACALRAGHRLALSGTPIENRLLDLWSIMNFAMPGALGNRTAFSRNFNGKDDPLARRRLAARVRPFVLRRTKKEVAQDLPDRTEEEIVCELEGPQAALYRAELKRARAILLKAKTSAQLDTLRFNILTSLLRLRQICCHPALVGAGKPDDDSAKLAALLDLLEPLMEEGHKVLVFSQFVEMLELLRTAAAAREWPHLLLTGQTEDRGALVDTFQRTEGASIFFISLKAGGFGLNLTAASYVVLFDPWWNPAVENQAIDRTHRIGQTNKVIAYRLLARDTIEEKIRELQKKKSALASDIFGEESFAKALTLDDFRFLLGEGGESAGD